jgi:hypothetical protein
VKQPDAVTNPDEATRRREQTPPSQSPRPRVPVSPRRPDPGLDSLPQVQRLPRRLRQMLALLLAHTEQICQADVGSLEFHYYRDARTDSVKAKLVQHLKEGKAGA